jgi:nucleoside-diphosphate-sugar epimerase
MQERQSEFPNVKYVKVDYSNIKDTTEVLETHRIDTVLSAIAMENSSTSQGQLDLIAAAEASTVTKRFIPSEFGAIANEETAALDPYCTSYLENAEALAKTKLQYSRISVGFLMDFWGMPHIKTEMTPFKWAIDVENGVAAIPGTGNEKLSMTYTHDIAKFIVRLLEEPDWPEQCAVVGQDVTFNQLLGWAENATGKRFKIAYDSVEKLQKGEVTHLGDATASSEFATQVSVVFGIMTVKGLILMPKERGFRLNERFPNLQVLTMESMIKENWAKAGQSS